MDALASHECNPVHCLPLSNRYKIVLHITLTGRHFVNQDTLPFMRRISQFPSICLLLASSLVMFFAAGCGKDSGLSERERQELEESTAVLLPNEILEQEGIRFILNYVPQNADISLALNKDTGTFLTPVTLSQDQPFVDYSVLTDSLPENTFFTLQSQFPRVTTGGTYEVTVVGFTNLNTSKRFTISGLPFTPGSQGTKKSILRIRKGLRKYSFYAIQ
jgi:hypothetical protein